MTGFEHCSGRGRKSDHLQVLSHRGWRCRLITTPMRAVLRRWSWVAAARTMNKYERMFRSMGCSGGVPPSNRLSTGLPLGALGAILLGDSRVALIRLTWRLSHPSPRIGLRSTSWSLPACLELLVGFLSEVLLRRCTTCALVILRGGERHS